jgi:cell wall-associated NlpC family hydrolase
MLSFRDIGVTDCPRTSTAIMAWRKLHKVAAPPVAGDILWWPGHVAIATGPNNMIEAPSAGKNVRERDIWRKPQLILRYTGTASASKGSRAIAS